MESKVEKNKKRASRKQLEFFLSYLNDYPELLANQKDPTTLQWVRKLWSQIANKLNVMGGPVRPTQKWKTTLTHWRHSLQSRSRKYKIKNKNLTNGSSHLEKKLTGFEKRALDCFRAVDKLTHSSSVVTTEMETNPVSPISIKQESDQEQDLEQSLPLSDSASIVDTSEIVLPDQTQTVSESKIDCTETLLECILKRMEEKDKRDEAMFAEILRVQNSLADGIKALGDNIHYLIDCVTQQNS